jgi:multimeric flavodoxin WrbA
MKTLIILGSSRKDGETRKVIDELAAISKWDVIDLNDYNISYYDYEHRNIDDDYIRLMRRILENYDTLIFATPVYWYAMSGIMKVFFDRVTDLLDLEKELGRKLRSKSMAAVSCSIGNHLDENFWLPFRETAGYLGMKYIGNLHTVANKPQTDKITKFVELVKAQQAQSAAR